MSKMYFDGHSSWRFEGDGRNPQLSFEFGNDSQGLRTITKEETESRHPVMTGLSFPNIAMQMSEDGPTAEPESR